MKTPRDGSAKTAFCNALCYASDDFKTLFVKRSLALAVLFDFC